MNKNAIASIAIAAFGGGLIAFILKMVGISLSDWEFWAIMVGIIIVQTSSFNLGMTVFKI